jgi:hypothetical protein
MRFHSVDFTAKGIIRPLDDKIGGGTYRQRSCLLLLKLRKFVAKKKQFRENSYALLSGFCHISAIPVALYSSDKMFFNTCYISQPGIVTRL